MTRWGMLGRGVARARVQRARGQFAAEEELTAAQPGDRSLARGGVHLDLSAVLLLRGKPQEALDVLQRARARHPDSLELALAEAQALNHLDRFADQSRVLEAAAARFPARSWEPLRNLGKMYDETRQFDRVAPTLERALPGRGRRRGSPPLPRSGVCSPTEDSARAEKAVDHLLRAAALDPKEDHQWTTTAALLQR